MKSDPASERAVLSILIKDGQNSYIEVSDILDEECFTVDSNKIIYRCLYHIFENRNQQDVDLTSILSAAEETNLASFFASKDERDHLKAVINMPAEPSNLMTFAGKIVKLKITNNYIHTIKECERYLEGVDGTESVTEITAQVEDKILGFSTSLGETTEGFEDFNEGIEEYIEYLIENPTDVIGINTGFLRFNEALGGGLRKKSVNLIGSRSGIGKSTISLCIGRNVAAEGRPVLYLDTEMSKRDHWVRMISHISGVSLTSIEKGKFDSPSDIEKVRQAYKEIKELPISYEAIAGQSFKETLGSIRRWAIKKVGYDDNGNMKDCLVILDYMKLMDEKEVANIQEYQKLGFMITGLHNLVVKLDIPCLALVQLNRDGISKESTDVISGSDRLLWLCSTFAILKRKTAEEIAEDGEENGNRKLIPLKTRFGKEWPDGEYINVNMDKYTTKLTEISTRSEMLQRPANSGGFTVEDKTDQIVF